MASLIESRASRACPRHATAICTWITSIAFPERPPPADLGSSTASNSMSVFASPTRWRTWLSWSWTSFFTDRPDLARVFAAAYFQASGDVAGRPLLPFYTAYRAAVRAKVEGVELAEKEIPEAERAERLCARAPIGCWPERTGSTWPATLPPADGGTARHGQIDPGPKPWPTGRVPRDSLGCRSQGTGRRALGPTNLRGSEGENLSTGLVGADLCRMPPPSGTRLVGRRAIVVDANFRKESQRRPFFEAAARWTLPAVVCQCEADAGNGTDRLQSRAGDASDADWHIFQSAVREWEEPGPDTRDRFVRIDSAGSEEGTLAKALDILHRIDVY